MLCVFALFCCVVYIFVLFELGVENNSLYFLLMFMGRVVLFICIASCVLYYTGFGVKRVHDVLA